MYLYMKLIKEAAAFYLFSEPQVSFIFPAPSACQPVGLNGMLWLLLPMSLKLPTPSCSSSTFHGPPPHIHDFPKSVFCPSVHPLRAVASHCLCCSYQPARTPATHCSDLNHPALACAVCGCSCLQTLPPRATFLLPLTWTPSTRPLPGQGSANSPWPPTVLSVTAGQWQLHSLL